MFRRSLLLVCLLALTACRLDVTVTVDMEPDGTGVVAVVAVADAELVERVPDLVGDLRLDDAVANGWLVDGPTETDDGGLEIALTHEFRSAEELANVLNSIGPPLTRMAAARTPGVDEQTTNAINGEMVLENGFETFADADLLQAVGGLPFSDEFAASGLTPAEAMSFTYRVSLPGELVSAAGTEVDGGVIEWRAALDGSAPQSLYVETVQRPPGSGSTWARPVATIAFVTLVVWVVVAGGFVVFVAVARGAKRRRRERALRGLERQPR